MARVNSAGSPLRFRGDFARVAFSRARRGEGARPGVARVEVRREAEAPRRRGRVRLRHPLGAEARHPSSHDVLPEGAEGLPHLKREEREERAG